MADPLTTHKETFGLSDDGERHRFDITWSVWSAHAEAVVWPEGADDAGLGPILRATVKWDGCANWNFSPEGIALHTCCVSDVRAVGDLMVHLRDRAGDLIPGYDRETAD